MLERDRSVLLLPTVSLVEMNGRRETRRDETRERRKKKDVVHFSWPLADLLPSSIYACPVLSGLFNAIF